jgi:hypothetical protein
VAVQHRDGRGMVMKGVRSCKVSEFIQTGKKKEAGLEDVDEKENAGKGFSDGMSVFLV